MFPKVPQSSRPESLGTLQFNDQIWFSKKSMRIHAMGLFFFAHVYPEKRRDLTLPRTNIWPLKIG